MNDRVVELMLERIDRKIPEADVSTIRRFAAFMDRASAWLTGHGVRGGVLRLTFSNDENSYTLTVKEMAAALAAVDRGEPFPWGSLTQAEPPPFEEADE